MSQDKAKFTSIFAGSMAAAVALATAFTSAQATTSLYSGGGTLAEKVYRDIFNAYGNTSGGDLCVGLVTVCPTTHYNSTVELLYVGVGSGNGKKAFDAHDASQYISGSRVPDNPPVPSGADFGAFYGSGTGASWVPAASGPFFPKVSFSGSDDPLTSTDITAINALGFGPALQVPALVTAVAIPFHPTAGWNPKGAQPAGGSSKVQLRTNTICGIFTGAITDWSNAEITVDNKGHQLGSGAITVVYRHDSSGTTFLTTNALLNQCGTASHPVSTHPVPDQWLTDNAITNSPPFTSQNSFYINVFNAGHLPSNFINNSGLTGVTGGAQGSHGVQLAVDATVGAIGYISPDFVQPIVTGNDTSGNPVSAAANIQSYTTYINGLTPSYKAPTASNATQIMKTVAPPSGANIANPLAWGVVNPTPSSTTAYPIGGFTFIDLYSCYASKTDVTALVGRTAGSLGYFDWYFQTAANNGGVPASILTADGFAPVPTAWATAAKSLLTVNTATRIGTPKQKGTACASITSGA